MKCADIMTKKPERLDEHDTVLRAACVMVDAGIGFLPICDADNRVIGVVTDRDLTTRGLAKSVTAADTSAALLMSSPAITCIETADVREAEALMSKEGKARLVITDENGALSGVLSLADLIERAPSRQSLRTARAVLWPEALGPRGGAAKGEPLLRDDPEVRNGPAPTDDAEVRPSVFVGGNRNTGMKEFP